MHFSVRRATTAELDAEGLLLPQEVEEAAAAVTSAADVEKRESEPEQELELEVKTVASKRRKNDEIPSNEKENSHTEGRRGGRRGEEIVAGSGGGGGVDSRRKRGRVGGKRISQRERMREARGERKRDEEREEQALLDVEAKVCHSILSADITELQFLETCPGASYVKEFSVWNK